MHVIPFDEKGLAVTQPIVKSLSERIDKCVELLVGSYLNLNLDCIISDLIDKAGNVWMLKTEVE